MGPSPTGRRTREREFLLGLARAFGGAVLFSLPLLMTMEMWWLGFYMDRLRLALFTALMVPVLVGLSRFAGFEPTHTWKDDVADGLVAYGVALVASAAILALLGVLTPEMPAREWVGKVALQAVPGAFGAALASSQMDGRRGEDEERRRSGGGFGTEAFLMAAGAVFLAFNVAPTEEMVLIAYQITPWHALATVAASLALMHAFVYAAGFAGGERRPEGTPWWSVFLRLTAVGYAVALLVSAYVLWTFGRFEDHAWRTYVIATVVLGFPASIGAAAARLLI